MEDKNFWKGLVEGTESQEVETPVNPHQVVANALYDMYDNFIKAGFTKDQAFWFVTNQWIMSMQSSHK